MTHSFCLIPQNSTIIQHMIMNNISASDQNICKTQLILQVTENSPYVWNSSRLAACAADLLYRVTKVQYVVDALHPFTSDFDLLICHTFVSCLRYFLCVWTVTTTHTWTRDKQTLPTSSRPRCRRWLTGNFASECAALHRQICLVMSPGWNIYGTVKL